MQNDDRESMRRASVDHGRFSKSPRNSCNFRSYRPKTIRNTAKHEVRRIGRGSFCARRNHRDFLAISWNIWAICLRDEKPRGVSYCPIHSLSLSLLALAFFYAPADMRSHDRALSVPLAQQSAKIADIAGMNESSTRGMNYRYPSMIHACVSSRNDSFSRLRFASFSVRDWKHNFR